MGTAGCMGSGTKKHPGMPSAGMTNAKASSAIPAGSPPSGDGQTSGVVSHKQMPSAKKVEDLSNFPKKR